MRRALLLGFFLGSVSLVASQPLYYYPSLIRGYQLLWQHDAAGSPNGAISFVGPFGLHPIAPARFGWDRESCMDSAQAFHLAETLWLEYFCELGDSTQADFALVYGPAHVQRWSMVELSHSKIQLEAAKKNPASGLRAAYAEPTLPALEIAESTVTDLGAIPKYTAYKVQPGDSLWKIHQKFPQHSLAQLLEANGGRETIHVGQILQIPL
jgi:hypothetical protein